MEELARVQVVALDKTGTITRGEPEVTDVTTLVIAVLVVGAVAGAFSLPIAVTAHEVSEFVVIASGLRMLRA